MAISSSIHVAANSSISLCFYAELYSIVCVYILYVCVCVYHIFFIHSSVNGNLGCFHVLIIVNSAAMNTRVNVSFLLLLYFLYFFLAMPRGMQNLNSLTTDQTFAPCSGSKESQLLDCREFPVSFWSAVFFWVYAQEWDCWIISQLYFQFFEKLPYFKNIF